MSGVTNRVSPWRAARIVLGIAGGQSNRSADWTATLLGFPWGQWLVGMIAAGLLIAAGAGLVRYSAYCFVAARYRRPDA